MGFLRRQRQHQRRRCPLRTSRVSFAYPLVFLPITMGVAMTSQVRQNYHPDCEAAVNNHIHFQLYVSYIYLSMAVYCDRKSVAQKHFTRFFLTKSHEWSALTEKFLSLQNERGGQISLQNIEKPDRNNWVSGLAALECALHLEITLNENFLELYLLATSKSDAHLCSFLQRHCLLHQTQVIQEMVACVTILRQMEARRNAMFQYLFSRLQLNDTNKEN